MSDTSSSAVGTHDYTDTSSPGCSGAKVQVVVNEGKGDKGDAATITVDKTTTLPAGQAADVKNTGTSSDAVLEFLIPKGDKGDPGDDATVTADTVIATTTNPKATLGQVTDAALAAVPKSAVGAQNGVQGTDKLGVIAVVNTTSGKVVGGSGLAGVATTDKETGNTTGIKSLGETLADMQIAQAATDERTASIDAHSGEYTGSLDSATVSSPNVQNTEMKLPDVLTGMAEDIETVQDSLRETGQTVTNMGTALTAVVKQAADLSEDGSAYTGDVSGANVTIEASDGKGGTTPQKSTVSAVISSLGSEVLALATEVIPKSDIGAADGVQGLDANKAIVAITVADDGTQTYAGTALVAVLDATGKLTSTTTLGQYLGLLATAVNADTQRVQHLSGDGSKYVGDVTGATGGVTAQTAPEVPTFTDGAVTGYMNTLVAALRAAGVFK